MITRRAALSLPAVLAAGLVVGTGKVASKPDMWLDRLPIRVGVDFTSARIETRRTREHTPYSHWGKSSGAIRATVTLNGAAVHIIERMQLACMNRRHINLGINRPLEHAFDIGGVRTKADGTLIIELMKYYVHNEPETEQEYVDRVLSYTTAPGHGRTLAADVDFDDLDKIADILGIPRRHV